MAQTQGDVLKELSNAWETAQRQLTQIREQVEQTAALATAKVTLNLTERELDKAYRDLGEAVWNLVQSGRIRLPKDVERVQHAVEVVAKKYEEENAGLKHLLDEGTESAGRALKAPSARERPSKRVVAPGKTKR
jgi:vacuolar-type H+-ATPase subunit E/Vma4